MRKMCHVEKIEEIKPIEGADFIEHVRVEGWWVVCKKGMFKVGDLSLYLELDAIPPDISHFSFLKGDIKQVGMKRLRTKKMKGCLSQGLLMPFDDRLVIFQQLIEKEQGVLVPIERLGVAKNVYNIGDDLTDLLQVEKYEPYVSCSSGGEAKGTFPKHLGFTETDEPRLQGTDGKRLYQELLGKPFYITQKLDGQSGTFYLYNGEFGVCSRSNEYRYDSTKPNNWWYVAKTQEVEEWLRRVKDATGIDYCLQGEVCGPKVQGNKLQLLCPTLFAFNLFDITNQKRVPYGQMRLMLEDYKAKFWPVPLVRMGNNFNLTIDELFELADNGWYFKGPDKIHRQEGLVIRHADNIPSETVRSSPLSFKVISNLFLLGEKE